MIHSTRPVLLHPRISLKTLCIFPVFSADPSGLASRGTVLSLAIASLELVVEVAHFRPACTHAANARSCPSRLRNLATSSTRRPSPPCGVHSDRVQLEYRTSSNFSLHRRLREPVSPPQQRTSREHGQPASTPEAILGHRQGVGLEAVTQEPEKGHDQGTGGARQGMGQEVRQHSGGRKSLCAVRCGAASS